MAFSIQRAVSDGTMTLLPVSIEYFDREEISVLFDGVLDARQWAWVGTTEHTLSFTPAVTNGMEVSVVRTTDPAALRHYFSNGAAFTAESLDESLLQILHIAQEAKEGANLGEIFQNLNFHGFKAINMGDGSDPMDAVNHRQMEVHDATIVGYMNAADASADAAAASAAAALVSETNAAGAAAAAVGAHVALADPHMQYVKDSDIGVTVQAFDADIATVPASQAEVEAGTETALRSMSPLRIKQAIQALGAGVQLSDFTGIHQLLASNGFQEIPGGFFIQGGSCTTNFTPVPVVFPTAFPTACIAVILCFKSTTGALYACSANSVTSTGFSAYNGSTLRDAYWIAIGY